MMIDHFELFQEKARDWAINHARAPDITNWQNSHTQTKRERERVTATVAPLSKEEQLRQEAIMYYNFLQATTFHYY